MKFLLFFGSISLPLLMLLGCASQRHHDLVTSLQGKVFVVRGERGIDLAELIQNGGRFIREKKGNVKMVSAKWVWIITDNPTNSACIAYDIDNLPDELCVIFDGDGMPISVQLIDTVH